MKSKLTSFLVLFLITLTASNVWAGPVPTFVKAESLPPTVAPENDPYSGEHLAISLGVIVLITLLIMFFPIRKKKVLSSDERYHD